MEYEAPGGAELKRRALFAVAIGPVGDLIAAARKTRDLSYGSWLLSECSKAAARFLRERGGDLIFPYSNHDLEGKLEESSRFAVVNKILAWADGDEESFRKLAGGCKGAVNEWLAGQLDEVNSRIPQWKDRHIAYDQGSAEKQIREVMEYYAAWAYYDSGKGDDAYKDCRRNADARLAGRKALRNFAKHDGSSRPKSSLDGNRETVIEHQGDKKEYTKFFIPSGELLDALGILKRVGQTPNHNQRFDSTHDVAAAPFVKRLKAQRPDLLDAYDSRIQALKSEGAVTKSYSYIYQPDDLYDRIRDVVDPIRALHPATPYYGILVGDGDFMGRTVGEIDSDERHREFSSTLSKFAETVKTTLDNLGAEPVFAGGDDVVAFLPLDIAIQCLREVNRIFTDTMKAFPVSFSAGLAVCHASCGSGEGNGEGCQDGAG